MPATRGVVDATPAATVAVLRDAGGLEVLLLRRNRRGAFAGNWVFPGGQVDRSDLATREGDELGAGQRAAVRETREEAGLDLDPLTLVPRSWWMPPADAPRRFATWFFLAPAPAGEVVIDGAEILEHRWTSPADALAERDRGGFELTPPTWMTLRWLARQPDSATALRRAETVPVSRFETRIAAHDGTLVAMWSGDAGYRAAEPATPGPRRRLVLAAGRWRAEVDHDAPD